MGLIEEEYVHVPVSNNDRRVMREEGWNFNSGHHPFNANDNAIIVQAFEVEAAHWAEEDYNLAGTYRDVYGTENFSYRVREQMDAYPGIHQSPNPPDEDPFKYHGEQMANERLSYWNAAMDNPNSFQNAVRSRQQDFDWTKILGPDSNEGSRAEHIGKMLTQCIPCFGRLLDLNGMLPDGDLLEIHALNIKLRTDILDQVTSLFDDPGFYIDICELLKMLAGLCPQDLLAIVVTLTKFLAKLNMDLEFNLDFIIQLIGPMLSPFLEGLAAWIDKWIQLFLEPLICIQDHITETIELTRDAKIPFSQVGGSVGLNTGVAAPFHKNASDSIGFATSAGFANPNASIFEQENGAGPHASVATDHGGALFNTPDAEKYNPTVPNYPAEEAEYSAREMKEAWKPSFTNEERRERNDKWQSLREKNNSDHLPTGPDRADRTHDGTRWSINDVPESEKVQGYSEWKASTSYNPPEKQTVTGTGQDYFVLSPLANSLVQLRNMLQGAAQWVKDWFDYITQMLYDILGTDIGWMSKKTGTLALKSNIIKMIFIVKAIAEAIDENGLKCGIDNNYDPQQMKFILEQGLNKNNPGSTFTVNDDGTVTLTPTDSASIPDTDIPTDTTSEDPVTSTSVPGDSINPEQTEQLTTDSGIIIKDCFKSVSDSQLAEAQKWISDFERRGGI